MEEKKFNFVYVTINCIDWKMYIGDHSTNDMNIRYTRRYKGSGALINNAIKKYGRDKFIRIELEFFNTKQEAFDAQEKYIKYFNTLAPNGYNISSTGGYDSIQLTKSHGEKISKALKGRKFTEEHKRKIGLKLKGRKHTEEHKENNRKAHIGKISPNKGIPMKGESIEKMINTKKERYVKEKHPMFGKHHSEKSKEKSRQSHLGKNTGEKCCMFGKSLYILWLEKHGKEIADEKLKQYKENMSISTSGEKNGMYKSKANFGKIWINDNINEITIKPEFFYLYESTHKKGRIKKK